MSGKSSVVLPVVALCCILLGLCACSSRGISVAGNPEQAEEKDPRFVACSSNDAAESIDPGKDKHVGCCTCQIDPADRTRATISIGNAYPGYECAVTVTILNDRAKAGTVEAVSITGAPAEITVTHQDLLGEVIAPGETIDGVITTQVGEATENTSYTFQVEIVCTGED